jgi:hypothetical protein
MTTKDFRSLTLAAVAALVFSAAGAAQTGTSRLMNSEAVRQATQRGDPADHAALREHFMALSERYTKEAKTHTAMAQSYAGNPRGTLAGMTAHCKRLAALNTESAGTTRELSAYYGKLANNIPATPPAESARFEGGKGAPEPTEADLKALAAKANIPAEHRGLAEYFQTLARRYSAEANAHAGLAAVYRGTRIAHVGVMHDRLATSAREAAKEATAAADMHSQLANLPPRK